MYIISVNFVYFVLVL